MERQHPKFTEISFNTAEELWEALSPTKNLDIKNPKKLIYRGQANSEWRLIPSLLREIKTRSIFHQSDLIKADEVITMEIIILNHFVQLCDRIGLRIPDDSHEFRRDVLSLDTADKYLLHPDQWPNPKILDLMAMAQHHGVQTRLLDWTTVAYTALYFASSSCLRNYHQWKPNDKLAVWVINKESINLHSRVNIHRSAGSVSPNLAAQYGQFIVTPHNGCRGGTFEIEGIEDLFDDLPNTPLYKVTLPAYESAKALELCCLAGFSAADIYPSADGAGIGVSDMLNVSLAKKLHNISKILVR